MFQTSSTNFLVQNVLFITLTNPLHVQDLFNNFNKHDGLWRYLLLVEGHVYFPLPPHTVTTTHMLITQFTMLLTP
jgi:hypothetical protein